MSEKLVVVRCVMNRNLLDLTKIDYPNQILVDGNDGVYGQKLLEKLFLGERLQERCDYVCFIDEDCLLYRTDVLEDIVSYMENNGIGMLGVPDGGSVEIRRHRPDVPNLFFVVMDVSLLRVFDISEYRDFQVTLGEVGETYAFDSFEPYYKTLCFMVERLGCKFTPLKAVTLGDGISTEVYFNGRPMCLHTWYARKYNVDSFHTERINTAIRNGKVNN